MKQDSIISQKPLSFMWPVSNPFIFCAHHQDHYPPGDEHMAPKASLSGRQIGQDFDPALPWRMYHGETVPGFPAHPHRGFETITIVTKGMVDHSDSHGQAGRYGGGDVQWMTAGAGLQHSEMFPCLHSDQDNPLELFQVWLNLPAANKMCKPYFKMLWAEDIPVHHLVGEHGKQSSITLIAGGWGGIKALAPAPDSWAARPENEVAIWLIKMEEGAKLTLPAANGSVWRSLFYYKGTSLKIDGVVVQAGQAVEVDAGKPIELLSDHSANEIVLLQGKPINEPIVQHGPFVMNSPNEIRQAFMDYQKDGFGGWPWPRHDNVHARGKGRFATHADGSEEVR